MLDTTAIDDMVVKMDEVAKFLQAVSKEETVLRDEQKQLEGRQQALLHDLEFSVLSRRQRNLIAKELADLRKNRRYVKMLIELIEPFNSSKSNRNVITSNLTVISNKIREIKGLQAKRTFTPKAAGDTVVSESDHYVITPKNDRFIVHKEKIKE